MGAGPFLAVVVELYLPPSESEEGVVRAVERAYRPLIRLLEAYRDRASLTVAIDPALALRLLASRQAGILHGFASLAESGSAELAAGTRNHALLPRIPRAEVERQLRLGDEVMKGLLGWAWRPRGLFPPALAYGRQVAEVAAARNLRWILLDEISLGRSGAAPTQVIPVLPMEKELCLFFRSRALSAAFLSSNGRALEKLMTATLAGGYGVAVIPAESLVEGSPGLQNLEWLLRQRGPTPASLSALLPLFSDRRPVEPLPASRRSTSEDLAMGIPFSAWSAPDNEIQGLLWHLAALAWTEAARLEEETPDAPETKRLRAGLDAGLHSAPFRQASRGASFRPDAVLAAAAKLSRAIEAGGGRIPALVHTQGEDAARRLRQAVEARGHAPSP